MVVIAVGLMMEGKALGVPVQHYLHPGNNITCS